MSLRTSSAGRRFGRGAVLSAAMIAETLPTSPLILRQIDISPVAEGSLVLRAGGSSPVVSLTQVFTGCGMLQRFELPVSLADGTAELPFQWDLRNAVDPTGQFVLLRTSDGPDIEARIILEPRHWGVDAPRAVRFSNQEAVQLDLELAGTAVLDSATFTTIPACVEVEATALGAWTLRETSLARQLSPGNETAGHRSAPGIADHC